VNVGVSLLLVKLHRVEFKASGYGGTFPSVAVLKFRRVTLQLFPNEHGWRHLSSVPLASLLAFLLVTVTTGVTQAEWNSHEPTTKSAYPTTWVSRGTILPSSSSRDHRPS